MDEIVDYLLATQAGLDMPAGTVFEEPTPAAIAPAGAEHAAVADGASGGRELLGVLLSELLDRLEDPAVRRAIAHLIAAR